MDIRLAPMEGVTDAIYRRVHHQCFGGVDKYYIPFLSPTQHHVLTPHDLRAVSPEANEGVPVVPQLLAKDAEHFLWAARELQQMGHTEVNLNIGCPSGTVTAKGKGSGMLREPDRLREFLDGIFSSCPLPISVKTRIGYVSPDEWPALLDILRQYPVHELIVHPRTRAEFYKEAIHPETFAMAVPMDLPLVYNGDLFDQPACEALQRQYPGMPMMAGRGLIANPALARQLKGGKGLNAEELRVFHDRLYDAYRRQFPADQAHCRIRVVMKYVSCSFDEAAKARKALCKSTPATYEAAAARLLDCPLRDTPGYLPSSWIG